MDIKEVIISFLIIGLFIIAFISFGVEFGEENDAQISIMNDSRILKIYTDVNATFEPMKEDARESQEAFVKEDKSISGLISSILFTSITSVGTVIMGGAQRIFDATLWPLLNILGFPPQVTMIVGTILTIILIVSITLLAWKLYRQGK